jgi:hypothetical protein
LRGLSFCLVECDVIGRAGYLLRFLFFDAWRGVLGGLAVYGCFDTCRNGRLFRSRGFAEKQLILVYEYSMM